MTAPRKGVTTVLFGIMIFYLPLRRLHVTSGFTPALSSRTSCCPPGTGPSKFGNAAPRAAARHTFPVALAGCHAGPVEIAAGRISKRIRSLGLIAG